MTTIAYRNGAIAADSLLCDSSDMRYGRVRKIAASVPGGYLAGAAGRCDDAMAFLRWFEGDRFSKWLGSQGRDSPPPSADDKTCEALVIGRDQIQVWDGKSILYPFEAEFIAIGSGAKYAMGAMAMGASAEEAVAVAIRFDMGSGAPIDTLRLDNV